MNLIVDGLPESVEIGGKHIPIHTDFRTGILLSEAICDPALSVRDKFATLLSLYYRGVPLTPAMLQEAADRAVWFFRCGKDLRETDKADPEEPEDPAFSYEYDADYIYAAFLQAYGIDLVRARLHWWQFQALFTSLPEDTKLVTIIGYRTMKIPESMPKEQKAFYRKMKARYALPQPQTKEDEQLAEILLNGGNPDQYL